MNSNILIGSFFFVVYDVPRYDIGFIQEIINLMLNSFHFNLLNLIAPYYIFWRLTSLSSFVLF